MFEAQVLKRSYDALKFFSKKFQPQFADFLQKLLGGYYATKK